MNLIVFRHGETDMNKEDRLQGSADEGLSLNDTGREMVQKLREGLLVKPDAIYSSPLRRTMETAEILNGNFNLDIIIREELKERDFGNLSGKLRSEVDPKIVLDDLEGHYDYHPYGGESVEDVRARVIKFLERMPLKSKDNVFVVTHRGIIRILYDLYPVDTAGTEILPASKHVFRITEMPAI